MEYWNDGILEEWNIGIVLSVKFLKIKNFYFLCNGTFLNERLLKEIDFSCSRCPDMLIFKPWDLRL